MQEIWFERAGARLFAVEVGGPAEVAEVAEGGAPAVPARSMASADNHAPVVLLHGGLADHRAALVRAGNLAARRRLITPDLRGAGRSHFHGELSWEIFADDLAALLDHLRLERAVIGGTSMGSGVAIAFALRHPRRVSSLLLMSPLYPGADRELAPAARQAMRAMDETAQRALEVGMTAFLPLFSQLPPPIRERAAAMMLGFDAASVAATTRFLSSCVQPMQRASDLAQLEVPALLIPGTDPEHPVDIAVLYAQHLRSAVTLDPLVDDLAEQLD